MSGSPSFPIDSPVKRTFSTSTYPLVLVIFIPVVPVCVSRASLLASLTSLLNVLMPSTSSMPAMSVSPAAVTLNLSVFTAKTPVTSSVPARSVAPAAFRKPLISVSPVPAITMNLLSPTVTPPVSVVASATVSVSDRVVASVTSSVFVSVVAFATSRVPWISVFPDAATTENVDPMSTFPPE